MGCAESVKSPYHHRPAFGSINGLRGSVTRDSSHRFQAARHPRGKRRVEGDLWLKLKYTSCGGPFEPHQPQVSLEKLGHATGRNVGTAIALGSRAGGS